MYVFTYFWLHWVFIASRALPPVAVMGATLPVWCPASHSSGFCCCGARALGLTGFSSCNAGA